MGDVEKMVRNKGLEGTLRTLRERGIYVTFEEYKSHVLRGGQTPRSTHYSRVVGELVSQLEVFNG